MGVTKVLCPLCNNKAAASDIDGGMRARVYCDTCTIFDITRMAFDEIASAPPEHLAGLSGLARTAPEHQVLVITRTQSGGSRYEAKESKADRSAPTWLPQG